MKKRDSLIIAWMGVGLVVITFITWFIIQEDQSQKDPDLDGRNPVPDSQQRIVRLHEEDLDSPEDELANPSNTERLAPDSSKASMEPAAKVLCGVMLDAESLSPLSSGLIKAWMAGDRCSSQPFSAKTDVEGCFTLTVQGSGPWDLRACASGYGSIDLWLEDPKEEIRILLTREENTIHGKVLCASGPVPGANVAFRSSETEILLEATSHLDGSYALNGIPHLQRNQTAWITASKEGCGMALERIDEKRNSCRLDLFLEAEDEARELWITCIHAHTRDLLPKASATLCSRNGFLSEIALGATIHAGFDGVVKIKNVPNDCCCIKVESPKLLPTLVSIGSASSLSPEPVLALLRPGGSVVGKVVGEGNKEIMAKISFKYLSKPKQEWVDVPRSQYYRVFQMKMPGLFEYNGIIPEVEFRCIVEASGYTPCLLPDDFIVESGKTIDLGTIRMERGRSIAGRVCDSEGSPVAGARLRVQGWYDKKSGFFKWPIPPSAGNGSFLVENAPSTPFSLYAFSSPGAWARCWVEPEDTWVEVVLDPREDWTLLARVKDMQGAPVEGIKLFVSEFDYEAFRDRIHNTISDCEGCIKVKGLREERVEVKVPPFERVHLAEKRLYFKRGNEEQELFVIRDRFITGQVLSLKTGNPVRTAEAFWYEGSEPKGAMWLLSSDRTDARGMFRVRATLEKGTIQLGAPGFIERRVSIEAGRNDIDLGELSLEPALKLMVHVMSPNDDPVADATVCVERVDPQDVPIRSKTDARGQAILYILEKGLQHVTASLGSSSVCGDIDCTGSGPWTLDLTGLETNKVSIRVRVLGPEGLPLTNNKRVILAGYKSMLLRYADTDEQGYVEFTDVLPGDYSLHAFLKEKNIRVGTDISIPTHHSSWELEACLKE